MLKAKEFIEPPAKKTLEDELNDFFEDNKDIRFVHATQSTDISGAITYILIYMDQLNAATVVLGNRFRRGGNCGTHHDCGCDQKALRKKRDDFGLGSITPAKARSISSPWKALKKPQKNSTQKKRDLTFTCQKRIRVLFAEDGISEENTRKASHS